jgi:hypothetical protein
MKKYLWILLLIPSLCWSATGDLQTIGGKVDTAITSIAGKAGTAIATISGKNYTDGDAANNTVDMSRGFEIVETERSDTASWSETDTASLLDDVDSTQAHSGTNSMSVLGNDATAAYQTYDAGEEKTTLSISFWFYAPESSTNDDGVVIATWSAATGSHNARFYYRKSSGGYNFGIRGTAAVYGEVDVATGAWYRVEGYVKKNDTSTVTIYNTTGDQVDTVSCTANNNAARYLYIGKQGATATTGWGIFYFDDLGMDYTDATTPLSPFTVAN